MATITRKREWVGNGAKRLREILPPPAGLPPVAGYTSWYDGDDLATFTLTNGAMVDAWADKGSGANNMATFSSVDKSPVLARHPSLFRGRLALQFRAVSTGSGTGLGSSATSSDMSQTAFVVAVAEQLNSGTLLGCNADGGNQLRVDITTGALTTNKADLASLGTQSNAGAVVGVPFVAVQALTASDVTHYLNGVSETDSHAQTFTASRTLQIGNCITVGSGNAGFNGWICEVIIYDTTLNGTDIATVTAWLRSKWAV